MFDKEEYSKIIEKGLIEKGYLPKPSFKEKLDDIITTSFDNLDDLIDAKILGIEKCGKGPSTGYVDGVQYYKDHQRVTNGRASVGNLEQKHLDKQLSMSTEASRYEMHQLEKIIHDYPEDAIGVGLHGEDWDSPSMTEDNPEYDEIMAWDDAVMFSDLPYSDFGDTSSLEDAFSLFEEQMNNAPSLDDNVMMFTQDIPNPELEEGDVFELDTYMGVNFKKNMIGEFENMWEDVDISEARKNNPHSKEDYYYWSKYNHSEPYDVTVLGSEGTPLLMTDLYGSGYTPSHTGVLNKGQKVRLVRVNHDKKTAIYQTVEG